MESERDVKESLNSEVDRGSKATALLENELLKEAFEVVSKQYQHMWEHSERGDTDTRERAWMLHDSLKQVILHIHSVVETGKLAKKQLQDLGSETSFRRKFNII